MFLGEDRVKVLWVDMSVVLIPLFGVDVPSSSQCIRFRTQLPWMEADNHVELGEEFRPPGLSVGQNLHGTEIL